MGWTSAVLGDLLDRDNGEAKTGPFGSQLHEADYIEDPDGIPVVMPKDMVEGRINYETTARISRGKAAELSQHITKHRDLLLPRRGDLGRRALIRKKDQGVFCGTGSLRVRFRDRELLPEFLFYFMATDQGRHQLESKATGVTMPNISTAVVRSLEISYPDIDTQAAIVSILNAYDELIEVNRRRVQLLEHEARLAFAHMFLDDSSPMEGELRFGDIASEIREGVNPSELADGTPYVGLEHIPRKSIVLSDFGDVAGVTSRKWRFVSGDILFGKLRPYFHKVARAQKNGVCSTDAIVIRPQEGYETYALFLAASDEFVAHASSTAGGTDRPRSNWKDLAAFVVASPTESGLFNFNRFAEPVIELMFNLVAQNRILRATRDLLLPRLVLGDVEISGLEIDTSWLPS